MDNAYKFSYKWVAALKNPAITRDCVRGRWGLNPGPPSNINNLTPKTVWTSVDKFNRY